MMDGFLDASENGELPRVLLGKTLGSLNMEWSFSLPPVEIEDASAWTSGRPDWPKDRRGRPYPFMPNQAVSICVDNGMNYASAALERVPEQECWPGVRLVVPRDNLDVTFTASIAQGHRSASNRSTENGRGGKPIYAQKYYLGAAAELIKLCAKLSVDESKVIQYFPVEAGPTTIVGRPVKIERIVFPSLVTNLNLNGAEPDLDSLIQSGVYGLEAQKRGTFYRALENVAKKVHTKTTSNLETWRDLKAPELLIDRTIRQVKEAEDMLERLKQYL